MQDIISDNKRLRLGSASEMAEALLGIVNKNSVVAILTHVRADGDAIGSCLGLAHVLKNICNEVDIVLDANSPKRYAFLDGTSDVLPMSKYKRQPSVVISLDTTDVSRHGKASPLFDMAEHTLNIDHHVSNAYFAQNNWVDPKAASTGEMIFQILQKTGLEIPPSALDALYVAMITDTGRFSFSNTTAKTLRTAADMLALGVKPDELTEMVYARRSKASWDLEVRVRASLEVLNEGRVAMVKLSRRDFEETKSTPADADDFSSLPRLIEGVDLGIFMYELENGTQTKIGLRTSSSIDANKLASILDGGGHPRAAGCTIEGNLEAARSKILKAALPALQEASS